ncbi:cytochrome c biogenesis protein CcsA [Chromohalobacter canadensis]|uniref:cytochrome C assembly family protein n=1 Tax=Chromohalobacter canadensis TaxID=141389 RepID=UPI0021BF2F0B|nr:cytochrome c biogenesis protein CcsA [Chromohalobacter canadensis]MCT8468213.1 cytochrome c biogenesis protein CcsA [Chromohalobacter canadensis]MCT8471268.1 cytochrome c biogenesis protein CcsA [Chromohalobacter canadensis]MCT8498721.1 cytochrome c biogenesis protein CcsA [Chromohalobacter canadensis]
MQALPFAILAIVCYLAAGAWQALALARRVPPRTILVRSLGLLAISAHTVVVAHSVFLGHGLHLGLFESASLFSWLIAALLIAVSLFKPLLNAGVGLFPLAALTLVALMLYPSRMVESNVSPGIVFHIVTSSVASALLSIAAVQAVLVAFQNHALKHRHTRGIIQVLPALTSMERLLFELIGAGLLLLTAAIVSGFIFIDNLFAQHLVHKTVFSLAAWLVFTGLLIGRHWLGWRGARAMRWTLGGCLLLVLGYFGTKVALQLIFNDI